MFFNNLVFSLFVRLKFLLLFRRKTWTLSDYPIRVFRYSTQAGAGQDQPISYVAYIHGWFLVIGIGNTRAEALAQLQQVFSGHLQGGQPLPRPGTVAPLSLSIPFDEIKAAEINQYRHLWNEVLLPITDVEAVLMLNDASRLSDIFSLRSRAEQNRLIALRYSIDISDIEDGNLLRIFQRIEAHRRREP